MTKLARIDDATIDVANEVLRETWRSAKQYERSAGRPAVAIRNAVAHAKRFVLDDKMSAFMAELSTVPFKCKPERRADLLDSLRHSAKLPFPKMFIQYNGVEFRRALISNVEHKVDAFGDPLALHEDVAREVGWLLEVDDQDEGLIWVQEYVPDMGRVMPLPFRWAYRTDDHGFHPRYKLDTFAGMFSHGLQGHLDSNIGVQYSRPLDEFPKGSLTRVTGFEFAPDFMVLTLVPEFGGTIRYVLCLLATLNEIPKVETVVRPQRGFLGGGRIRPYLDYTTLRLSLPAKQTTTRLATKLIAHARRGWHEVKAHWRIHAHGERLCRVRADHIWLEADETGHANCKLCDARRVWIVLPQGRGDPTISVRTHKYLLTHGEGDHK